MKNVLCTINVLLFLSISQCQSQTYGFVQSECDIVSNSSYYIENYQFGTHGNGFRLYHNGINIHEEKDGEHGIYGMDLRFIDSTTGFFVTWYPGNFYFTVSKIINDSVLNLGYVVGPDYKYFIVSRHTVYLAGAYYYVMPVIVRLSDLLPQKYLSNYNIPLSDTTVFDTIMGLPFCQGLNELNYQYQDSGYTTTFTIRFSIDTLANIGNLKNRKIIIYPNPAKEFINIKALQSEDYCSIQIMNSLGVTCKSMILNPSVDTKFFIGDLPQGVYFIIKENGLKKEVYKLIKI